MNKKVREPFLVIRTVNLLIGVILFLLLIFLLYSGRKNVNLEILIFALGAVQNFIAATVYFSEQKKIRGNLCAVLCALFFVMAAFLCFRLLGIL